MKLAIDRRQASPYAFGQEAKVKRLALAVGLLLLLALAACAPQVQTVKSNVTPTLFSATVKGDTLLLQGRYLGDGSGGEAAGSYVLLGANMTREGGFMVTPTSWRPDRIEIPMPENVGYGYVFVYVSGTPSNGLPVSIP